MRTLAVVVCSLLLTTGVPAREERLRPAAVPLVACDPYFSVWSFADRLTYEETRHWTGKRQSLHSLIRIDGSSYRLMGNDPSNIEALEQQFVQVLPTRTIYEFQGAGIRVALTFTTPALIRDLDWLGKPVTYIAWEARSADGREHQVSLYFDAAAELAVNVPDQRVSWSRETAGRLEVLRIGSEEQAVLRRKGDDVRIDWGHLYVAAPSEGTLQSALASGRAARRGFDREGRLPADDTRSPRAVTEGWPVAAIAFDLGSVRESPLRRHVILAYDDLFSIELLGRRLRPWWRKNGTGHQELLEICSREYEAILRRCVDFDRELMADLEKAGGSKYAQLCALAYRQALAAHKLAVGPDGEPLYFPKENFSNGCISTVDVIYPAAPIFLQLSPALLRASLAPLFHYVASGRWTFPFAPHDLGTYPLANGQVYGGGEKSAENQMPVEESGNMLLLVAALARVEGKTVFAARHWEPLSKWASYLREKGLDPENQLCTDDFAGHLAHNANLSLKAILALGAYARLAEETGHASEAASYRSAAEEFARQWVKMADDDGHYRLAFDRPGTWSQKYNLVWDRILGLGLFPPEVARREIEWYLKVQKRYGLPLDNRRSYTKLDWVLWSATLAESRRDFEALVAPAFSFADESPSRVPLTDWYWTNDATQVGFQARPVVGGLFIKLLDSATASR